MSTKYFLTDDAWLNLGPLPVKFNNNAPTLIYYIISDLAPGSLAEAHSILFTETETLTGTGTQRLYARLGSPTAGVFAVRDGENIIANRVDIVTNPTGLTIEEVVQAFKDAIEDLDTLNIVDPIPTFAVNNNAGNEAYIGFKGERGTKNDVYMLWNEAQQRWGLYETPDNNNLSTKTFGNIEFGTAYGALVGNAATASKLATPRNITIAGDGDGVNSFDGSANITITVTLKTLPGLTAGAYTKVTINTKGQVVSATQLSASDVNTALGYVPYGPADATSAATASKLALRNAAGDIAFNVVGATQFNGPLTGNASTATKLLNSRLINGRAFDGTADIALNTADVPEMTNLYFTQSRARNVLSGTGGIDYNPTTGVIALSSGGAPVTSVAGRTGAVTLTAVDVPDVYSQTQADAKFLQRGLRNYLFNGCLRINQRGASGGVSTGGYLWDRWHVNNGSSFSVNSTTRVLTLNGTTTQFIENPDLANQQVTVSVEDPSGTINVIIGTYDGTTATVNGNITAGAGRRSVTLTVPSAATGHVMCRLVTTGATTFKNIQLERGPIATSFEHRPVTLELLLCQRYYCSGYVYDIWPAPAGTFASTYRVDWPVTMRASPSLSFSFTSSSNLSTYQNLVVDTTHWDFCTTASVQTNTSYTMPWSANSEL